MMNQLFLQNILSVQRPIFAIWTFHPVPLLIKCTAPSLPRIPSVCHLGWLQLFLSFFCLLRLIGSPVEWRVGFVSFPLALTWDRKQCVIGRQHWDWASFVTWAAESAKRFSYTRTYTHMAVMTSQETNVTPLHLFPLTFPPMSLRFFVPLFLFFQCLFFWHILVKK